MNPIFRVGRHKAEHSTLRVGRRSARGIECLLRSLCRSFDGFAFGTLVAQYFLFYYSAF